MIDRYSREKMKSLWTDENKYRTWLKVEILACEAMAELGHIPAKALDVIRKKADFSVERIEAIEAETKHDVIAFLTAVAERVGPESRYIHMGLTSSDILDTSLAFLMKQAGEDILDGCRDLMAVIRDKAFEHKDTVMAGRSHGVHAEPITFGLKLAVWHDEMRRSHNRFSRAVEGISVGQISGAVGTFASVSPRVEAHVCEKLGLSPAPASTQVIQRDRHAAYFTSLAIMAATIEKMAVEIRHLQRTEVLEAEERFAKGQKGSSAMPHKRNPIASENLSGLSRIIRSNAMAAIENIPLWHERDISHSSVERIIAPDSTILMDYMLARMTGVIRNLAVYPERMKENLNRLKGLMFSQQVLLSLVDAGASREEAYKLVQTQAMRAWEENADFKALLLNDKAILDFLGAEGIEALFDPGRHLTHIDFIFDRVFSEHGEKTDAD
ncbi:Adenylosuccinate lyase [Candidatus Desulfarcum epimagneticum]|uniref:Adenylosuccinate lyase n=1 Tax=uncultured Desulfobacteraceae bacterium TaxID=218296 RepID=A0A484HL00_9BACT|nr:Adenylosuccinate lyase [uncultured Desulfobacteraceae bacterium]